MVPHRLLQALNSLDVVRKNVEARFGEVPYCVEIASEIRGETLDLRTWRERCPRTRREMRDEVKEVLGGGDGGDRSRDGGKSD